jgi:hypothetical protein
LQEAEQEPPPRSRPLVRPEHGAELGTQKLQCNRAIVTKVSREINCRHSTSADLALDLIAFPKIVLETI